MAVNETASEVGTTTEAGAGRRRVATSPSRSTPAARRSTGPSAAIFVTALWAWFRPKVVGRRARPETGPAILAPGAPLLRRLRVRRLLHRPQALLHDQGRDVEEQVARQAAARRVGAFPVHRESADREALQRAEEVLRRTAPRPLPRRDAARGPGDRGADGRRHLPVGPHRSTHRARSASAARTWPCPRAARVPKPRTIQVVVGPADPAAGRGPRADGSPARPCGPPPSAGPTAPGRLRRGPGADADATEAGVAGARSPRTGAGRSRPPRRGLSVGQQGPVVSRAGEQHVGGPLVELGGTAEGPPQVVLVPQDVHGVLLGWSARRGVLGATVESHLHGSLSLVTVDCGSTHCLPGRPAIGATAVRQRGHACRRGAWAPAALNRPEASRPCGPATTCRRRPGRSGSRKASSSPSWWCPRPGGATPSGAR